MREHLLENLCNRFRIYAIFSGTFAILMGLLVLIGWYAGIEPLKRILPGLIAMHPLAAVCFTLCGFSLFLQVRSDEGTQAKIGRFLALLVSLVGFSKLVCFQMGWTFPPDTWFYPDNVLRGSLRWRQMAQNTSLGFALTGAALFLLNRKSWKGLNFTELLVALAGLSALLALVGHIYGASWLYGMSVRIPMALHTAFTFMVLAVGTALSRPKRGTMSVVTGDSAGGIMARRIFPAMVLVFISAGALRIIGERKGYYDAELGIALYAVTSIAILGVIVLWCARSLHRSDIARQDIEREHDRFFRLSLDMLCIMEMDGRFKRINPAFGKTLGFTTQELLGKSVFELVHPDDIKASKVELEKLADGHPTFHFENRYLRSDGTWRWLQWNTQPVTEEGLLYAVARDVTEKKEAELANLSLNAELLQKTTRLQGLNEELESFSYSVSHDLRAPLRAISGFAEAVEEHAASSLDETAAGYLYRVRRAAERMGGLIDNLLKLSQLSRTEMTLEPVDVSAMAAGIVSELRASDPSRQVEVHIGPAITVMGDQILIGVLLENLIGNAWKFTSRNPQASIRVESLARDGEKVSCQVIDNGVGFDMRYANKLFGAFQRLHSQVEFPGIGIGLATVQRIVRRHGGEVRAESEINHGATFEFTLEAVSVKPLP